MPDHPTPTRPGRARRPAHVLFFAAVPPDPVRDRMARAWQASGSGERIRYDKLHMSIYAVAGMDDLDPIVFDRARRAVAALRTAPFQLCFDRLMTFGGASGNRALVLATDGRNSSANEMAMDLHAAFSATGVAPPRPPRVVAHVTLAYGPGFPETRPLAEPILWAIRDITLIDSLQGQGRHVPLGQWPLPEGRQQAGFDF